MRRPIKHLLHCLLATALCVSCSATLAVPKAAENEDAPVTFGDAAAPPKPTTKSAAAQPVAKTPRQSAGQTSKTSRTTKSDKKPAAKRAPGTTKLKGSRSPTAAKAATPNTAPAKSKGKAAKK